MSPELARVAKIDWKGAKWEAARGSLTIPELLTTLKGYGPMEVLRFTKRGCSWGELSLCLAEDGGKEVTLYHLEVPGPRRKGQGRESLVWLKQIFRGPIFLEFPDRLEEGCKYHPSLPFWLKMYKAGLIDALDCETFYLGPLSRVDETEEIEREVASALSQENPQPAG